MSRLWLAALTGVVGLVVLVAATNTPAPTPQAELQHPVDALSCLPTDQIAQALPYGGDAHPTQSLAIQAFLENWPALPVELFAVDYASGGNERRVMQLGGERKAVIDLESVEGGWIVSNFAACNTLLVDGAS